MSYTYKEVTVVAKREVVTCDGPNCAVFVNNESARWIAPESWYTLRTEAWDAVGDIRHFCSLSCLLHWTEQAHESEAEQAAQELAAQRTLQQESGYPMWRLVDDTPATQHDPREDNQ